MCVISGLKRKEKAVSRKDLDLRGVAGQAVQSMFVVTIREKQTTFCQCSASTTCHCLARNIHAESTRCQPMPPQRGNGNRHCEFSSPPKHLCVDFSDNKPTLSNNAPGIPVSCDQRLSRNAISKCQSYQTPTHTTGAEQENRI